MGPIRPIRLLCCGCLAILVFPGAQAWADLPPEKNATASPRTAATLGSADVADEQAYLASVPIVLLPPRLAQPTSESPVAVTIIDSQLIEASGVRRISDLLRLVPGMIVGSGQGLAGPQPVVGFQYQGDPYARRMQVLIDGRSVYSPLFGMVEWDELPLAVEDIERIEVARGPNAASYGANAFESVINIITRSPVAGEGGLASVLSLVIQEAFGSYEETRRDQTVQPREFLALRSDF